MNVRHYECPVLSILWMVFENWLEKVKLQEVSC